MTELVNLGVKVDTSQADASLQKFANNIGKTSNKTSALSKVLNDVARVFSLVGLSISKSNLALMSSTEGATKAQLALARGAVQAAEGAHKEAISLKELNNAATQAAKGYEQLNNRRKQLREQSGLDTRGAAQSNRFNSGNMLAQFQDIAVTSAMGMNPMLIAMQQGTQLQYILAQSNAPLKDFVAGLKSAFSVAGLLAIGLTGLVAVLIQMVNWTNVGKTTLNGLANVFDFVADNATVFTVAIGAAGTALVLFNGSAIVTTIANLAKLGASAMAAGAKIAASWVMAMGPVGWVLSVITMITTAWLVFPETIEKIFKFVGKFIKDTLNQWIGYITSFGYQISGVFDILVNAPFTGWDKAVKKYEKQVQDLLNKDYVGSIGNGLVKLDDVTGNVVSGLASGVGSTLTNGLKKASKAASETFKSWSDGLGKTETKIKDNTKEVQKLAEAWNNLNTNAEQKIDDLLRQRGLIGAGTYESTYEETLAELTKQAQGAGIEITDEKYNQLKNYATATAQLTDEVKRLNDTYNFAKSTVNGFFTDMRHGLRDGQSAWEAFGNAVMNVLDKILDKMMDIGVDMLFQAGRAAGWFNFGGGHQVYNSPIGPTMPGTTPLTGNALGGVWQNGVQKFARGGVVNSPTMFGVRGGLGVMGEAGPEAVMPLTRGPDGSLGVRADGVGGGNVVVNVINNSNAQARTEQRQTAQGVEIDVMIDELVAEKMNKNGTASNTALRSFSNQRLITR